MVSQTLKAAGTAGLAGLTACLVALILTPFVRAAAVRFGWIAKPVEDRWGRRVVARLGGMAMFLGFGVTVLAWVPLSPQVVGLLVGAMLVFLLGLVDDLRRLLPSTKLVGQLLIGCLIVISGVRVESLPWPWLSIPLSVFWFVLVMNAFNLLDNMDGLAAGVGAIAAAFCALHAVSTQQWVIVSLGSILCGACLGFLRYNFPPAKIYMGDSGSHFLGLTLAGLALFGSWQQHSTQLVSVLAVPVLVLAVPIFDTCFVAIQRVRHRQSPFVGGTDHVSHRLAVLGLSVRQTVIALYGVSACLGLLSLLTRGLKPLPASAMWLLVATGLVVVGRYLSRVKVYRLEHRSPGRGASLEREHVKPSRLGTSSTLIETMLLHKRRLLEILIDFSIISSVYVFAHLLRYEGALTSDIQQLVVKSLPIVLVIKIGCFAGCNLYRGVWRYLGLSDIVTIFKAVTLGSILSSLALLYLWRFEGYSRAVSIIDWMLTFLAVGGSRVAERLLDEWITRTAERGVPVIILGAGDTGEMVLRYLKHEGRPTRRVVGFLDDDLSKHGSRIHGCAILGGRAKLSDVLQDYHVREVLIAISDPPGELLQHVQRCCEPCGASWKVVTAGIVDAL